MFGKRLFCRAPATLALFLSALVAIPMTGDSRPSSATLPVASPEASQLRDAVERHRAVLGERLATGEDGLALGRANARFLKACFDARFAEATRLAGVGAAERGGLALAAVGSLGRGAVALRSDADVVLVVDATQGRRSRRDRVRRGPALPAVGRDARRRPPGAQRGRRGAPRAGRSRDGDGAARPAPARGRRDRPCATSSSRANEGLFGEEELGGFIDRLDAEATARHERFGGSVYLLEPDVKSGAGGLRDLDGARWGARARYRITHGDGDAKLGAWGELVRLGVLVGREAQEFAASEEFLWRVRNRLHARAGRKSDRLGFEEQEALAIAMGYGADRALAAERLMQDYYLHARNVTRARASLLERLRPMRRRTKATPTIDLGKGVRLFDGHVTMAAAQELPDDPALALRVFAACVRQEAPVLPFARDAITRMASDPAWCARLRADRGGGAHLRRARRARFRRRARAGGRSSASFTTSACCSRWCRSFSPSPAACTTTFTTCTRSTFTRWRRSIACASSRAASSRTSSRSRRASPPRLRARGRSFWRRSFTTSARDGPTRTARGRTTRRRAPTSARRILPRLGLGAKTWKRRTQLVLAAPPHVSRRHAPRPRRRRDDRGVLPRRARARGASQSVPSDGRGPLDDLADGDDVVEGAHARRALLRRRGAPRRAAAARGRRARRAGPRRRARPPGRGRREPLEALLSTMPERYLLANGAESIVAAREGRRRARRRGGARRSGDLAPSGGRRAVRRRRRSTRACSRASRRRSRRAGSRCWRRRSTRARSGVGARPSTSSGCAIATGNRRSRGRVAAARARSRGRVLAPRRPGGAPASAHRLDVALARAAEPRGAHRDPARRSRVAAPHGRRGLRQGPAGPALHALARASRARPVDLRCRRSTPRGRGSPTSSTWARSTARRSRAARATTRSTRRSCAPSRVEESAPFTGAWRRWEDGVRMNISLIGLGGSLAVVLLACGGSGPPRRREGRRLRRLRATPRRGLRRPPPSRRPPRTSTRESGRSTRATTPTRASRSRRPRRRTRTTTRRSTTWEWPARSSAIHRRPRARTRRRSPSNRISTRRPPSSAPSTSTRDATTRRSPSRAPGSPSTREALRSTRTWASPSRRRAIKTTPPRSSRRPCSSRRTRRCST